MDDLTVYVLLEFLYNKFAVTFVFCSVGYFIREFTSKDKKSKTSIIKKFVITTMFSTFLMCACAEYIDLPIGVYAIFSIFCGIWGLQIINIVVSGNFFKKFTHALSKLITNPVIKSAVETASDVFDEQQKEEETEDNKDEQK